jgi:cytochrome c oxidase subunit IV
VYAVVITPLVLIVPVFLMVMQKKMNVVFVMDLEQL